MANEVFTEATKAAPAVAVGSLSLFGYSVSDWATVLTIIYVLVQLFFLLRDKWWRDGK